MNRKQDEYFLKHEASNTNPFLDRFAEFERHRAQTLEGFLKILYEEFEISRNYHHQDKNVDYWRGRLDGTMILMRRFIEERGVE